MLKKHINKEEAIRILREEVGNKFYSVIFTKRSNGKDRKMTCRNNVNAHRKGGIRNYDPKDYNLLGTYSMDSKGYRTINLEGLKEIKVNGVTYQVKEENQ